MFLLSLQVVYDNILEMRKERNAPVDSMGCERAHDTQATPTQQRFQCLVSLMLSSMTKVTFPLDIFRRLQYTALTVFNWYFFSLYLVVRTSLICSELQDEVNYAAMMRLREHGLSVDSIIEMSDETLGKLIYPVGFWKVSLLLCWQLELTSRVPRRCNQ